MNTLTVVGLNLTLQVGQTSETVTVSAAPPALDTSDAQLGASITNEEYTSLPVSMLGFTDSREAGGVQGGPKHPDSFITLLPGVSNVGGFSPGINGGEAFSKEINVNGAPVDSPALNGDWRNLTTGIQVDFTDQFKVVTNGTPAYYSGQGTENFVLKSGTNRFHGAAYEYVRNRVFDARDFFASKTPPENQHQFGFNIGGPIVKGKVFFFGLSNFL